MKLPVIWLPVAQPFLLLFLLLTLVVLVVTVELQVLAYAYRKIGIRPRYVFVAMLLSLVGSHLNIPLYTVDVEHVVPPQRVSLFGRAYIVPGTIEEGATVVAVNVGGALVPVIVSLYLFIRMRLYWRMLVGVGVVALIVHSLARIVPGVGIAVPMLVPPLAAALTSLMLSFRRAPPVAYVSGSMGTLIGADVSNLGNLAEIGAPLVSIGGAGTFDGVFLTGILAGLLV